MRLDVGPVFLNAGVADAWLTSPLHRQCIADALAMRRDPPTPSSPTPSRRPLKVEVGSGRVP
eukprot:9484093-Pyramimonas_sp.AAC.1